MAGLFSRKKEEDRTFIRQEIIEYLQIDDKNC